MNKEKVIQVQMYVLQVYVGGWVSVCVCVFTCEMNGIIDIALCAIVCFTIGGDHTHIIQVAASHPS